MNLSDQCFLWDFTKGELIHMKDNDSNFMSPNPNTSPSSYSSTSMDSGHESPFHSSQNVHQNMTDHMQAYYNTNFHAFGSPMGNTPNYHNMSQPYTTSSPAISTSSDADKYCATNQQELFKAELKIVEQPKTIFRFRYETEMQGPHGMIQAKQHSKNQKVYPTVKLNIQNYDEQTKFMIKCSLYQYEPNEDLKALHPHKLIMRSGDFEKCDPHYVEVSKQNDFTAVFQGLGIIQTKKDSMKKIIHQKIKTENQLEQNRELLDEESKRIIADADKLIKKVNINQVRLGYTAFMKTNYNNTWIQISDLVLSNVINNKKSGKVGDLKICRMSTCASEADGNQEIFMFVSKVDKNTIKVRFFETDTGDPDGYVKWENFGRFSPSDVHHQFGIVFRTPPYKDQNIETNVKVFVQLFRSTDKSTSEALDFLYKPNSHNRAKRKRHNDDTIIPTVVQPYESGTGEFSSTASSTTFPQQTFLSSNPHQIYDINQNTSQQQQQDENENDTELNVLMKFIDFELSAQSNNSPDNTDIIKYYLDFNNDFGLVTDAPKSMRRDSVDVNFSILDKLKMIIKLFKDKYEDEQISAMMMVLIKAAEDKDENILTDVIQYGTMNDIKELVLILVKYKMFEVFKSKNEIDQNALHLAINLGYTSLAKVLIKFGVDINATDAFGMSPLHVAVHRNSHTMVQELLSSNKEIALNEFDDNGYTPLMCSVMKNNLDIVKTLMKYGANVLKQNPTNGYTCLQVALLNENIHKELIRHLIESSDETLLSLETHEGLNAMEFAIKNKLSEDVIELISSYYDDYDDTDKKEIFDDICVRELCEIFDKDDKWKIWVIRMDLGDHIKDWINCQSPSKELLQHLIKTKKTLHDFIELLDLTDDDEREGALNSIDEMVVRQYSK